MKLFILGAPDPEMREIARVLKEAGQRFVYAQYRRDRVMASNAYKATGVSGPIPKGAKLVFVECAVVGLTPSVIVDHHNEGDPGYACAPADYMKGSSLGQVLSLLGKEPTAEQRIICAADHCPHAAYQGNCPGVDVEAFSSWRIASKAQAKGVSVAEMQARLDRQVEALKTAERLSIAGTEVLWVPTSADELPDASARLGIPVMYCIVERDGRNKAGILNAPAHVIEAWMAQCGLANVYGNPHRGYAGGYA